MKYTFNCQHCTHPYDLELTEKQFYKKEFRKFCTRSCANSRKMTKERLEKITLSSFIRLNTCEVVYQKCPCGILMTLRKNKRYHRKYCTENCVEYKKMLSESARNKQISKRSKNEIEFAKLCIAKFKNVECNVPIFNGWDADIIIHDLKIAVLWNGKWHYEKCAQKHSVAQVQNRDKIKIDNIVLCGYKPYTIKDLGKSNLKKVQNEFDLFVAIQGLAP